MKDLLLLVCMSISAMYISAAGVTADYDEKEKAVLLRFKIVNRYLELDPKTVVNLTLEQAQQRQWSSDQEPMVKQLIVLLQDSTVQSFQSEMRQFAQEYPDDSCAQVLNDAKKSERLVLLAKLHCRQNNLNQKSGRKKK